MSPNLYAILSVFWLLLFLALVWFRKRIRFAQLILVVVSFALLGWLSAAFDWGILNEREFQPPPPDMCWDIVNTTDLLNNQSNRQSWLFRGQVVSRQKENGAVRIVALGSSSTFGSGLLAAQKPYPTVMEQALRERLDQPVEVVNAGMSGYHSFQLMIFLTQVLVHLSPDLVLFYYGKNEGSGNEVKSYYAKALKIKNASHCQEPDCLRWALAHGTADPVLLRLGVFLERFGLYRYFRNQILRWRHLHPRGIEPAAQGEELPPSSQEILKLMCQAAREHNFRLILTPEFSREGIAVNLQYAEYMQAVADDSQIVFLDLASPAQPMPNLFQDEIHPTAVGHQVLGRLLADELIRRKLMP